MNSKDNGALTRRPTGTPDLPAVVDQLQELPPWMKALREAMTGSITGDDITQVMKAQVDKAKEGDLRAASFVMNQAHKLMATQSQQCPATIVQNNYYDTPADERPDAPLQPGDEGGKDLRKMRARARAGMPLTGQPGDRRVQPVSDEEEKELRRREAAEED